MLRRLVCQFVLLCAAVVSDLSTHVCVVQVAAEKAAWEASKKHDFELVTICPTFVLGPVISNRADATSILDVKVPHCSFPAFSPATSYFESDLGIDLSEFAAGRR